MDDMFNRLGEAAARMTSNVRTWPVEPFTGIRWRKTEDPAGKGRTMLEVAWHDAREQLRIATVQVDPDQTPAFAFVGGDEPGEDESEVLALLSYDYALSSRAGCALWEDEAR